MGYDMTDNDGNFTPGTLAKLRLYGWYMREWLPVFYSTAFVRTINIVDFFCGPGRDSSGTPGSPMIILKQLSDARVRLQKWGGTITVRFNDSSRANTDRLTELVQTGSPAADLVVPSITTSRFEDIFEDVLSELRQPGTANLILLDQFGVKSFTIETYRKLASLRMTDFLAFFATEHLRRFANEPAMKKYHEELGTELKPTRLEDLSSKVSGFLRAKSPKPEDTFVSDFTIKKGSNLYTIIFGSGHPRGVEKFVRQCWREDPFSGRQYDERPEGAIQSSLFGENTDAVISKDVSAYQRHLKSDILSGALTTTKQVFIHYVTHGFLNRHARAVLEELKKEGHIPSNRVPGISYEVGYKQSKSLGIRK